MARGDALFSRQGDQRNNLYSESLDDLTLQELLSNQPTNYFNNQPLQPTSGLYQQPRVNTPVAPTGPILSPGPRVPHVPTTTTSTKPIPQPKGEESVPTKDDQQPPIKPPREESLPDKNDDYNDVWTPGSTNPHDDNYNPNIFAPGGDIMDNPNFGSPNQQVYQGWYNPGFIPNTGDPRVFDDSGNLSSLFGALNKISMSADRVGGSTGGGSEGPTEGNMESNPLSRFNEFLGKNVTSFDYGGKYKYNQGGQLTPTEMKKVQNLGEYGDTQLAHINPQEAQMLKAMGGSGTINPYTGLPEYHYKGWNPLNSHNRRHASNAVSDAFSFVGDNIVDPIGDFLTGATNVVGGAITGGIQAGAEGLTNILQTAGDGAMTLFENAVDPFANIVESLTGFGKGGGREEIDLGVRDSSLNTKRGADERIADNPIQSGLKASNAAKMAQVQKSKQDKTTQGDWVGDKPNPYLAPNIEEELDYAAKGMKMPKYNQGGMYEQAANQAIAENQLSGLVANLMNKRMPMANYGMKRKYQEGGNYPHNMYHPETGYKIVAEDESAHNKLNAAGFGHAPKAAYGMKKRYTQGGRF